MPGDRTILDLKRRHATPVESASVPVFEKVSDDIVRELQESIATLASEPNQPEDTPMTEEAPAADFMAMRVAPLHYLPQSRLITQEEGSSQRRIRIPTWRGLLSLMPWIVGAGIVVLGLLYVSENGFRIKSRVVRQGNAAIANLASARDDLERLDLVAAQGNFQSAAEHFQMAQEQLGIVGSWLLKAIGTLPGGASARAAQDLVTAGRAIADAGVAMSQAVNALSDTGIVLNAAASDGTQSLDALQEALERSDENLAVAYELLAGVDPSAVPAEVREDFIAFRQQLPELQDIVHRGMDAVLFLEEFTGADGPRQYLVLFENSSELRPTGGFPGTYGLLTFENGRVKNIRADDIYNPDGQIQELIVPPQQLQHITPSWGVRDAAWFVDFPASAKKAMEFWRLTGGAAVDGVIVINDTVLTDMLGVIGPVQASAYGLTLDEHTALAQLQQEVEYGPNNDAGRPKQIISDLAPALLQRIAVASPNEWLGLLGVLQGALRERDVLMYFPDASLQEYVVRNGWDGAVRQTDGDYLQVNIANVKGAKADAVTDTAVKLESWMEEGTMIHRLTLTRRHDGGATDFGFYNKTNYSWVRVLVPEGSTVRDIVGNDRTTYRPLISYAGATVVRDPDLQALESTYRVDAARGVTTFTESGKTGFGFWMSIAPGRTEHVQIEYAVPARVAADTYALVVQRQPGLTLTDFEFTLQKKEGTRIGQANQILVEWPDSWRLHSDLATDLELSIPLR